MAKKWGFIGCGNLAQAIIEGAVGLRSLDPQDVSAFDLDSKKLSEFCKRLGISPASSVENIFSRSEVIVLGTKPQDIQSILEKLSSVSAEDRAVVSLAAGVSDKILLKHLGGFKSITRVMANTPALVQKGIFGIFFVKTDAENKSEILRIFESLGEVIVVNKNAHIDALTSASASGVGFVLSFMEEYEKWLAKKSFSRTDSRKVATSVFLGTAFLAQKRTEASLGELRYAVTSKKGTTLAGLNAMRKAKVPTGLKAGLDAGLRRAVEISKDLLRGKK